MVVGVPADFESRNQELSNDTKILLQDHFVRFISNMSRLLGGGKVVYDQFASYFLIFDQLVSCCVKKKLVNL